MPIIETRGSLSSRGYGQFAQGGAAPVAGAFIEDVFSTTLYTGTGAAQSIANGIALGTGATSAGWFANTFGPTTTSFVGVAVDSTGNAYACGYTVVSSANVATLTKFSPTGAVLWQTSLPPSGSATATIFYDAATGPSGDVYVCGQITFPSGSNGYLVVKYNSNGALQWQFSFTGASPHSANAIAVDSSDFVYVTGDSGGTSFFTTIKLNSSGALQWQVRYAGEQGLYGRGIAVDASGNAHVVGTEQYSSGEDVFTRAVILKYNTSGTLLWRSAVGQASDSDFYGSACALDASGNVYVVAHGNTLSSTVLTKFSSIGNSLWQTRFSTSALQGAGIATSSSGDSYISVRTGGALNNGFIAKIDTSGALQWQRRIQTSVFNAFTDVALSGADSLWVVGGISTTISSGLAARLPVDGSGTGAYNLNGLTLSYAAGSELYASVTRPGNTAGASSVGVLVSNTLTSTDTPTFLATALTPLAQGTGRGGLVWIKGRSGGTDHALYDTTRGATADLVSNSTAAQTTQAQGLTAFLGSGFSIGSLAKVNTSAAIYAAWTFAEQSKFFDIVTYTGTGSNRTINHNLGSVPGCIIVKCLNQAEAWTVYHRSLGATQFITLNDPGGAFGSSARWNNTEPTATVFSLGTEPSVNGTAGRTFVAYLFAHDAGGFGASGTDNVISCGSYTGNGSATGPIVTLGWEPQWLLIKRNGTGNWAILDNVRGLLVGNTDRVLVANQSLAESSITAVTPTATGFQLNTTDGVYNASGSTYVYIAIRRGPMRTPTLGTNVFMPTVYTGTNVNNRLVNTSIAPDMVGMRQRNDNVLGGMVVGDRLRGQPYLLTGETNAELTSATAFDQQLVSAAEYGNAFSSMNGVWVGTDATAKLNVNTTANNHIVEAFKRAPGFFNSVCYTGTASSLVVTHGLGVTPELIISKNRTGTSETAWYVGSTYLPNGFGGTGHNLQLNSLAASAQNGYFTSVNSTTATFANPVARDGQTYIAHFFASCPGVSKVGSYTGTGSTLQVNCGFTSGARFVLIKRMNASGAWFFWDSARGIVSGNDPYLRANSTDAEVTGTDWVDTLATGFEVSNAAGNDANVNGGTYLFLAIA